MSCKLVPMLHKLPNSYSLQIIIDWVKENGLCFKYSNALVGFGYIYHGIRLSLGRDFELSIQTHPDIASYAFAETALFFESKMVNALDYKFDFHRWSTPDELFRHINALMDRIANLSDGELFEIIRGP